MNTAPKNVFESSPSLAEAIASHPFVSGMKPEHLQLLADVAMLKHFDADQVLFHEGEPANRFYLLCQGKVALDFRGGDEITPVIQFLGEGDVLGWSWLFPPYYWHFGARAVEPTNAIFFYGTRLREQCDENPAFGYDLMKRVAGVVIKRLQIGRVQLLQAQQDSRH
jgi:CRP/FNR family cyclic AMP-dependent transcriptional regulator